MGPRWGLAWQTLPRTGGVCWATAGPPASSRTGWALHSSNGLSSPIKASVSGPGTAVRIFSKPSMPCWWREPTSGWVTNVTSLGFYSRLFLVPKKTGDLRPVIDLSTLNRHMVVPHFKMETQGSVQSAIRSQEWTVSIDIRDAYLHVPMHQAISKYLRFMVNKKVY